jgi:xylulose-5-phosphate/fructose-6-phosphate phosphoketolase
MHEAMATTLDTAVEQIKKIQQDARMQGQVARPRWPMIVLNSPKGWTGPKMVDGLQVEGTFRAHQVPLSDPATHPEHLKLLEDWLKSYRPEELFDEQGRLKPELAELAPKGERRMARIPMPTAVFCSAICGCRISAITGSRCPRQESEASATRTCSGVFCAM